MKLLLTTPCDRVIEDPESGHTLVAVFHEIKIQLSENAEVPESAVIPREWNIFTKFGLDHEEEGKNFTLHFEVYWPNGALFSASSLAAKQPTKNGMAFKLKLLGFPIGQPGKLKIVQSLKSEGELKWGPFEIEAKVVLEKSLPAIPQPNLPINS